MEAEINKELLFNHFARKSSPLQRELIAKWLREAGNEERYYEWLEEWETRNPQYMAQTETAVQSYVSFINEHPHTADEPTANTPSLQPRLWLLNRTYWLVAACFLLIAGSCVVLFRDELRYQTYTTAFGETQTIQLADNSLVVLNANSSLQVPRWGFGSQTREVILTGEANFSVTHTPTDQKFVVKTPKNVQVTVLGTEFTVFARKRGARVFLNKGKVKLQYQDGRTAKQLTMKPGDLVTLDAQNHFALKAAKPSQQKPIWNEKRFVFEETTLEEVAYLLEDNYGLQVAISDSALAGRVLMGSFRADNVDQLLLSISELLDINVVRQGNQVQITNK